MITDEEVIEIALGVHAYVTEWGSNDGIISIIRQDHSKLTSLEVELVCEVYDSIRVTTMPLESVAKARMGLLEFYKEDGSMGTINTSKDGVKFI